MPGIWPCWPLAWGKLFGSTQIGPSLTPAQWFCVLLFGFGLRGEAHLRNGALSADMAR